MTTVKHWKGKKTQMEQMEEVKENGGNSASSFYFI